MSQVKFQNKVVVAKADSPIQPEGVTPENKNVILVSEDGQQMAITGGQSTVSNWLAGAQQRAAQAAQEVADLQGLLTYLQS